MDKDKIIKTEMARYRKIYKDTDPNKKLFVEKLYTEAAYMYATLKELRDKVNKDGAVIKAINGNGFETTTEHPAQKSYNTTIKNYSMIIKQLDEMVPKKKATNKLDELMKE